MEPRRFDAFARGLAQAHSRRGALRRLAVAGAAALLGRSAVAPERAQADHCNYIGCGCATGTLHPCGSGLVCCPSSPGLPGGGGVCSQPSDCGGSCTGSGGYCGDSCNWGDTCPACCSGYCGQFGACA